MKSASGLRGLVSFGSKPVLADLAQRRRLSEVERTSRPRKRTLPLEGRLSRVDSELGQVLVGNWIYQVTEAGAVLSRLRDLAADAPRELTTGFVLSSAGLQITVLWSGTLDSAERSVASFGSLANPSRRRLAVNINNSSR